MRPHPSALHITVPLLPNKDNAKIQKLIQDTNKKRKKDLRHTYFLQFVGKKLVLSIQERHYKRDYYYFFSEMLK